MAALLWSCNTRLPGLDWFGLLMTAQGFHVIQLRTPFLSEPAHMAPPGVGQCRAGMAAYSNVLQGCRCRISWQTWWVAELILNFANSIHRSLILLLLPACDFCLFPYICFYPLLLVIYLTPFFWLSEIEFPFETTFQNFKNICSELVF